MTHEIELDELLTELERVGVDPHTVSAGLAVPRDEMVAALRLLPDNAGPTAVLAQIRQVHERTLKSA